MARDKALVPFLGLPLIERLKNRFSQTGDELLVISNHPASLNFLDLPVYQDILPDRGALGGLYTALSIASHPLVGLIAVDLPFASPALIQRLAERVNENDLDLCLPTTDRGLEPMHAVYRVESCLPLVKEAIDNDLWRMNAWHEKAKLGIMEPGDVFQITQCEYTFLNLNTPKDLEKAEKLAQEENGASC